MSISNPIERSLAVAMVIDRTAAFEYAYTKVQKESGEALWRWPHEPSIAVRNTRAALEPKGQIVDVSV